MAYRLVCAIALFCVACGDDGPVDGGADASDGAMDTGADAGDVSADTALPPLGPRGCFADVECESGACFHPIAELGLAVGYCTVACESDADCTALEDGGHDAACVAVGGGASRCLRVCELGFGCPGEEICLTSQAVGGGNTADICADFSEDACESDGDCEPEAFCRFIAADREKVARGCFVPLDPSGRPTDGLRAGETCDPRGDVNDHSSVSCASDDDCPTGWDCRALSYVAAVSKCHPPIEEQCLVTMGRISENESTFFCSDRDYCGCQAEGVCSGLCGSDEDCGPDMRCSQATLVATRGTNFLDYDDSFTTARLCTYAAGSRTPCVREADCATTGTGGARETCKLGTELTGATAAICVTPAPGIALPGEACGDDLTTAEIEEGPCVNECVVGTCAAACDADADCPGGSCISFFIDQQATGTLCVPDAPCDRDADCTGGSVCRLVETAEGALTRCGPPRGVLAAGATCRWSEVGRDIELPFDIRCATMQCQPAESYCPTLCASDTDCPTDYACVTVEETLNGRGTLDRADDITGTYGVCERRLGTLAACMVDADCVEFNDACLPPSAGGGADGQCVFTLGSAPIGESGPSCHTLFGPIFDYRTAFAYCPGPCTDDADCGGSGLECRRFRDDRVDVEWTLCVRPDDPRASPL